MLYDSEGRLNCICECVRDTCAGSDFRMLLFYIVSWLSGFVRSPLFLSLSLMMSISFRLVWWCLLSATVRVEEFKTRIASVNVDPPVRLLRRIPRRLLDGFGVRSQDRRGFCDRSGIFTCKPNCGESGINILRTMYRNKIRHMVFRGFPCHLWMVGSA